MPQKDPFLARMPFSDGLPLARLRRWLDRRRAPDLHTFSDKMLDDIGISRADLEPRVPFTRTTRPVAGPARGPRQG